MDKEVPKILYRYRSLDERHDLNSFRDGYLWCSSKDQLNDPFELSAREIVSFPEPNVDPEKFRAVCEGLGGPEFEQRSDDWPWLLRAFKLQVKGWSSSAKKVSKDLRGSCKVCCFSENPDDLLMWGHYGGGLSGVVVGYDTSVLAGKEQVNLFLMKALYPDDNRVPEVNLVDLWLSKIAGEQYGSDIIRKMFCAKPKCWEYESEWRFIIGENKYFYPAGSVKEVIFGQNIDPKKEAEIRRYLQSRGIVFKRAKVHRHKYELKMVPA